MIKFGSPSLRICYPQDNAFPDRAGELITSGTDQQEDRHACEKSRQFVEASGDEWKTHKELMQFSLRIDDDPLEFALYEQTDVADAVKLLDEHGVKYNPEVLARKTTVTAKRRYLWPKLRAVKALADYYPGKIQLACRLVDWAMAHKFYQRLFLIVGIPVRNSVSTSVTTSGIGSAQWIRAKAFTGAANGIT